MKVLSYVAGTVYWLQMIKFHMLLNEGVIFTYWVYFVIIWMNCLLYISIVFWIVAHLTIKKSKPFPKPHVLRTEVVICRGLINDLNKQCLSLYDITTSTVTKFLSKIYFLPAQLL